MSQPTAVLFLTHVWNDVLRLKFARLQREIGARADVFVLIQRSPRAVNRLRAMPPDGVSVALFEPQAVASALGIPMLREGSLVPGSTHYPLLVFAGQQRGYRNFLLIEFDVEFSGNWGDLLDQILASGADFASTHFRTKADVPEWPFWPSVEPAEADLKWAANPFNLWRSFNPIYFVTRHALGLIHKAHRAGWRGHYECVVPTILSHRGCTLFDFAEGERFCVGHDQNLTPDQPEGALSTMRWRPPIKPSEFEDRSTGNTLFHPVKGPWYYDGSAVQVAVAVPRPTGDE